MIAQLTTSRILPCVFAQWTLCATICGGLKFAETPGLCCLSGNVKLPLLPPPPETLHSLLRGEPPESQHFLSNTQRYNGCFQMTSFGADIIESDIQDPRPNPPSLEDAQ